MTVVLITDEQGLNFIVGLRNVTIMAISNCAKATLKYKSLSDGFSDLVLASYKMNTVSLKYNTMIILQYIILAP